jgi:hypothetical protein
MSNGLRFLRFIKSAGVAGLTGAFLALALLIIAVVEHVKGENVPVYWLVGAAVLALIFGGYRAWTNEHEAYLSEVSKNLTPRLKIEQKAVFFDTSVKPNTKKLLLHFYAYLSITNLTDTETLIKDGTLSLTVGGQRYTGVGDDFTIKGNAIEHVSNFKLGNETLTEVFGNTLSAFPRLSAAVNGNDPLKRGITKDGFFIFTFEDANMDWDKESLYLMPVSDYVLTLRDSFDASHKFEVMTLQIPQGSIQTNNAQFLKWKAVYGGGS